MPLRHKRNRNFDPNKSDSDDETYGTSASKPLKLKPSKTQQSYPSRKRQRRQYDGDDSEEDVIEESDLSGGLSDEDEIEDEEVEVGPSGRPRRQAAKKQTIVEDSDSDDFEKQLVEPEPTKRRQSRPSLVVKLKVQTPAQTPAPRRSARARSGSIPTSRPNSSHNPHSNTRRSSRIAHDETDPVIALTNSGHHVDVLRAGTRSPPDMPRPTRGAKGVKKLPTASVVYEESEQSSAKTRDEPLDYRPEIAASRDNLGDDDEIQREVSAEAANAPSDISPAEDPQEVAVIPESGEDEAREDDDEDPISKPGRSLRRRDSKRSEQPDADDARSRGGGRSTYQNLRSNLGKRKTRSSQRSGHQESSDFEPDAGEAGEEDVSDSEASSGSPRKNAGRDDDDDSSPGRRDAKRRKPNPRSQRASDEHDSADEVLEELQDLAPKRSRRPVREAGIIYDTRPRRRQKKEVDYRILNPELAHQFDEEAEPATTPSRKGRAGGGWQRSLFNTYGPFGGAGGPAPVFGGPGGIGAAAGADSDSSDDENMQRPRAAGIGGTIGMTPTTAFPSGLNLFPPAPGQVHGADPLQGPAGTPANLGKIKDKSALADVDPLGVDQNVDFDSVGGLQGHIDQLKEMVALPLLYPEVFQRFHVTPPRGVLFHGPPGTGKTLLARALASSVSSQGRKVTFYMRKGADALSKWVGEAERQLRLLFEEARKNQPSIIFFDEIDGLAPVRSSKQEQIHASIVSTLLALMDGMDGRGQVIVIGATNRPDSIDPALRRPGRFDREFYFPLPSTEARRAILEIHTKNWDPPLASSFKDEVAHLTKGYGGADLRALCTEAALNAVQRRYPQIYKSNEKLQINPQSINVTAKDFMISVKNMVPSSERSASSGAAALPKQIEPLLRQPLAEIEDLVGQILPQKKRLTALQEAEFEDAEHDQGMKAEQFERSRVFRPRLLLRGLPGMGQQYLAGALLNHFEGLHVQSFDLPTLLSDSTRSSEAAIVQLFTEVRRHKPSVIYIPNVDVWYRTVGNAVISTFLGLLRTLAPTDPVLLLGVLECEDNEIDPHMIKDLFGFSRRNQFDIPRPERQPRHEYFLPIVDYINASPADFPEPADRKRRQLEILIPMPPEPPKEPPPLSKAELKAQKKKDRQLLNLLKQQIQPVMDQIKTKSKKFRTGVVEDARIRYLFEEDDLAIVSTDLPPEERGIDASRPYEKANDDHGEAGLLEVATGKFIYNMETVTIEKRLSNGYYKRPKDFTADIKKLAKDAKATGDQERIIKANELLTNVEVDMDDIGVRNPALVVELENVYARELKREKEMVEKAKELAAAEGRTIDAVPSNVQPIDVAASATDQSSGPIVLGQLTNGLVQHPITPSNPSQPSTLTNGMSIGLSDLSDLHGRSNSNGTSVPSRIEEAHSSNSPDIPSTERHTQNNTQSSSFGQSAQTREIGSTGGPGSLAHRLSMGGSLSQRGLITPLAEGSTAQDYDNYASTTSSEKRNTGSSGNKNTQSTTGKPESGPEFMVFGEPGDPNSQIPDTRVNTQVLSPSAQQPFKLAGAGRLTTRTIIASPCCAAISTRPRDQH
ncbi:ATPase family AAA domain-containing protein 2, partial [Lecanoromycetidae sp. Uapishka_2]